MTQSSIEFLGEKINLFICPDVSITQKICVKGKLKIPCLALCVLDLKFS